MLQLSQGIRTLTQVLKDVRIGTNEYSKTARHIIEAKGPVLRRYQPIFSTEKLPKLDAQTYHDFLLFDNNCHWSGIHRQKAASTKDMPLLRSALLALVDESRPIAERLQKLRPQGKDPLVRGLGRAILTALLQVVQPDRYGVWNGISEEALRELSLWPKLGTTDFAGQYEVVNDQLRKCAAALQVDLWTLDVLWWRYLRRAKPRFRE